MSRYRDRPRDFAFMMFVKTLPCMWRDLGGCAGPIEADHAGRRGLGQKAPDNTCVPACQHHHRQRTDHSGPFRAMTREQIRVRLDREIEATQQRARAVIPSE